MKIVINGLTYDDPQWNINNGKGELRIATEDDFQTLTEHFNVSSGDQIIQTDDGGSTTGAWFANSLESIQIGSQGKNRMAIIVYGISTIPGDIKEALDADIEDGNDAIIELAMLIEELLDFNKNYDAQSEAYAARFENQDEQIDHVEELTGEIVTRLDALADRVARLENRQ